MKETAAIQPYEKKHSALDFGPEPDRMAVWRLKVFRFTRLVYFILRYY